MTTPERKRRKAPERTAPIRNRAVPGASSSAQGDGRGFSVGGIVDQSVQTALRVVEASNETIRDSVERGVDTAYRVVEEYMLRGRQQAGRYNDRATQETGYMNDNRQNGSGYGGGYGNGGGAAGGPWSAANPMMAPWTQMMRMWAESMSMFMPGGANMANDWMNSFMPGAAPASGFGAEPRRVVTVQLSSIVPASVTVDLDGGAEYARLTVEPLRSVGQVVAPPLSSVSIGCVGGEIRVSLNIPAGQPSGQYTGAIVDGMGARRGELRAHLEEVAEHNPLP